MYSSRFSAQCGAIAGIQTHADHLVPLSAQFAAYLNGVTYAVDGVIGVNEKNAVVRHRVCVRFKCFALVFEKHDPAMRLRAADRDAELFSGLQIRCAGAATDVSR